MVARGLVSAEKAEKSWAAAAARSAQVLGINNEELASYAHYLEVNNQYLEGEAEKSMQVALAYERIATGLGDLTDNFADYKAIMSSAGSDTAEYAEAITNIEKDLQNLFNTDEDIDQDFITKYMDTIEKAANGSADALRDLQAAYAESVMAELDFTGTEMESAWAEILQNLDQETYNQGFTVDFNVDTDNAITEMYNALAAAGATSAQIQEIFNSIGWELEPIYEVFDAEQLYGLEAYRSLVDTSKADGTYSNAGNGQVSIITGFKNATYTGGSSSGVTKAAQQNKKGSKSGGKSSKKEEKDAKDEFERYYKITRQIKDQEDAVNRLSKAKDRAYGKAKLEYLDQETEALEKQLDLQKEYIKEIEDYYRSDKSNLKAFGATFDSNGVLTNYESLIQQELDK